MREILLNVRFSSKAAIMLRGPEMTRWAKNGLLHCGKAARLFVFRPPCGRSQTYRSGRDIHLNRRHAPTV
jgi:hypothetical protein